MSDTPEKDFGPIAEDYAFFETHATEAEEDARAYAVHLAAAVPGTGPVRMLDFGCGSGTFTTRFLRQAGWPPGRLRLTLVEPVESARREGAARLTPFTDAPVAELAALPEGGARGFDVVLANHVLYYVSDLAGQLSGLIDALSASGLFLAAMAGRANALIEIWIRGFALIGREVPYNTSEDVEAALRDLGADYQKEQVFYELTFPDTEENRMKILRFLLADYLAQMPHRPLLDLFDRYTHAGQVSIRTASDHFRVRAKGSRPLAPPGPA